MQVRVTTDSGVVKALCPKNPLAVWALTYGKHITPVFHMDMTPFLVEYTSKTGKVEKVGQLLYDLKKRLIVKEYSVQSATGCVRTRVFKSWITTSSLGLKGKVVIL